MSLSIFLAVLLSSCPDNSGTGGGTGGGTVALPFTGKFTLDEYDFISKKRLSVIDIQLPAGQKTRVLGGFIPWRHPQGKVTFLQSCGAVVQRVMIADKQGLITPVSPCSSDIRSPSAFSSNFDSSRLSSDQQKVAVESYYLEEQFPNNSVYTVIVYDLTGNQLSTFVRYYSPAWLSDGRLVMAGNGIYVTDGNLQNLTRIDGNKLNGPVNNFAIHPSGDRIAFEYNQQLWQINVDGSDLKQVISGAKTPKHPAWSPDGKTLAFLKLNNNGDYDKAIYFYDIASSKESSLDMSSQLGVGISFNGPLSWTQ